MKSAFAPESFGLQYFDLSKLMDDLYDNILCGEQGFISQYSDDWFTRQKRRFLKKDYRIKELANDDNLPPIRKLQEAKLAFSAEEKIAVGSHIVEHPYLKALMLIAKFYFDLTEFNTQLKREHKLIPAADHQDLLQNLIANTGQIKNAVAKAPKLTDNEHAWSKWESDHKYPSLVSKTSSLVLTLREQLFSPKAGASPNASKTTSVSNSSTESPESSQSTSLPPSFAAIAAQITSKNASVKGRGPTERSTDIPSFSSLEKEAETTPNNNSLADGGAGPVAAPTFAELEKRVTTNKTSTSSGIAPASQPELTGLKDLKNSPKSAAELEQIEKEKNKKLKDKKCATLFSQAMVIRDHLAADNSDSKTQLPAIYAQHLTKIDGLPKPSNTDLEEVFQTYLNSVTTIVNKDLPKALTEEADKTIAAAIARRQKEIDAERELELHRQKEAKAKSDKHTADNAKREKEAQEAAAKLAEIAKRNAAITPEDDMKAAKQIIANESVEKQLAAENARVAAQFFDKSQSAQRDAHSYDVNHDAHRRNAVQHNNFMAPPTANQQASSDNITDLYKLLKEALYEDKALLEWKDHVSFKKWCFTFNGGETVTLKSGGKVKVPLGVKTMYDIIAAYERKKDTDKNDKALSETIEAVVLASQEANHRSYSDARRQLITSNTYNALSVIDITLNGKGILLNVNQSKISALRKSLDSRLVAQDPAPTVTANNVR